MGGKGKARVKSEYNLLDIYQGCAPHVYNSASFNDSYKTIADMSNIACLLEMRLTVS